MKSTILKITILSMFVSTSLYANRIELDKKVKGEIITVLEKNEAVHAAFFKYDGKKIEVAAKAMSAELGKISDKSIHAMLKFANQKLLAIKSTNSKKVNNTNYHIVSSAVIFLMNKYDLGKKYNAYSCPMVKKKWIQNSSKIDEVSNPYDDNMPNCGKKDTAY
jgi:hypothetical protein